MATLEERFAALQAGKPPAPEEQETPQSDSTSSMSPEQQRMKEEFESYERWGEKTQEINTEAARYLQNLNIGLANTLGAPVEMVSNLSKSLGIISPETKPFLGSEQVREFFTNIGAAPERGKEQKGYVPRALRLVGETALPYGGAQAAGAKLAQQAATGYNSLQKALLTAYQSPWKAAGAEATAVLGGAGGGELAAEMYPDNYMAQAMGELLGGITPATVSSVAMALPGPKTVRAVATGEGASERAAKRIAEVSSDLDKARIRAFDASELELDPMTATGDAGLLALEKAALENDPKLADRVANMTNRAMTTARSKVIGEGNPQDTTDYLNAVRRNAAANAQKKISALGEKVDAVTASKIVRQSVESSLSKAKEVEKAKWSKLPYKGRVNPEPISMKFEEILADRSIAADPEDIPAYLYNLIGKMDKDKGFVRGPVVQKPELKTMKDLRSRLQQSMAEERAKDAPNRNKIRILGEIEDSLYETLADYSPEYADAVAFSRGLNERFTRGKIGKLLGYERTGEVSVSEEGSLNFLLSGNKDKVRMGLRQLQQASPEAIPAVKESIKGTFLASSQDDFSGALNVRNARRFLQKNQHVLDEFPDIKTQIEDSIRSQRLVDELAGAPIGDKLSTYMKDKSVASLYLDGTPDAAMHRLVTAKTSQGAGEMMRRMVAMTDRDPSGRATKGLKSAFGHYLLNHSESGDINNLSGKKFLNLLTHLGDAANQLYTKDEVSRLFRIGTELQKIEARQASRATKGGVISDVPNKIISLVGGTYAARMGAQAGAGTSGASLRTSGIASREFQNFLGKLTNDGAEQIIMKAVEDPAVLKTLLKEASPENVKEAIKVFKSFLPGQALAGESPNEDTSLEARMRKLGTATGAAQ